MLDFLKKWFGKPKAETAAPLRRISAAPGQSQEEQDATRSRMESEMTDSRTARDSKKEGQ
jgi:hypothetical protein